MSSTIWWTPTSIIFSSFYSGPDKPSMEERARATYPNAKVEYTQSLALTTKRGDWGDADHPPVITTEDRKILEELKVKW